MRAVPPARKLAFAIFFALIVAACAFQLGPVILAGLFSYMILDLTYRKISGLAPKFVARWICVAIFLVTATALASLFAEFIKLTVQRMPLILGSVLPAVDTLASKYGIDLPFENLHEARVAALKAIKDNAHSITATSGLLTRGFFQIIIGIFVAVTKFLSDRAHEPGVSLYDDLSLELSARMRLFMASYEKVLGAQVVISLINTAVTSIFIAVVGIPYLHFLTLATFILGVVPLLGNVASNSLIIGAALTVSPQKAVAAFVFLVVSHKFQYFLNSRIIGSTLKTPMWMTLLGLLIGEVVMGVPGLILAPALLHYAREELAALPPLPAKT